MASADFSCPAACMGTIPNFGTGPGVAQPVTKPLEARPTPTRKVQLDWNQLRPTGGEQALQKLVVTLATNFDGIVFIATTGSFGQLASVHCSDKCWSSAKRLPAELSSALLEATTAQSVIVVGAESPGLSRVLPQALKTIGGATAFAISLPLRQSPGRCGLLLVCAETATTEKLNLTAELLTAVADQTAQWMDACLLCQTGQRIASLKTALWNLGGKRTPLVATVALLLIMALAIPVPYWPKRECVIEPTTRQFVASPIAGRMERALVEPGDPVSKGQSLARLHGDELRLELSSAQAELEAASKKKEAALATGAAGNMRIAQLEQQQIALRIESIRDKLERLEVSSPIDGVIVQGDWTRREGAPLEHGETLFEIAPLGQMTVEAHLRTEDLAEIEVGDEATLRVDSAFGHAWHGKLTRIDPRARVIDDQVVFIAEMTVDNDRQLLRPGTHGSVRISPGAKSIGWLLFSQPYHWLMKKVVW